MNKLHITIAGVFSGVLAVVLITIAVRFQDDKKKGITTPPALISLARLAGTMANNSQEQELRSEAKLSKAKEPPPTLKKLKVVFEVKQANRATLKRITFGIFNAEVGAPFSYLINDQDDSTPPIEGSGVIKKKIQNVARLNLATLSDGEISLTVTTFDSKKRPRAKGTASLQLDSTSPRILKAVARPANYFNRELILTLFTSEMVLAKGYPKVPIRIGDSVHLAYIAPTKSPSTTLKASYKLAITDIEPEAIAIGKTLDLTDGSIVDPTGNPINPSLTLAPLTGVIAIARSCRDYKDQSNETSGIYLIDIDEEGPRRPIAASCDMTTDGGGWTLILNYLHKEGTNPAVTFLTKTLPLENSTALGNDESGTASWGHASPTLLSHIPFSEMRFRCQSSDPNSGVLHFSTKHHQVGSYIRTGSGSMKGLATNAHLYPDHTASIPQSEKGNLANQEKYALTNSPFWGTDRSSWTIGFAGQWECDNASDSTAFDTHHQVWVR